MDSNEIRLPLLSDEAKADVMEASMESVRARANYRARLRDWLLAIETVVLFVVGIRYLKNAMLSSSAAKMTMNQTHHLVYSPAQDAVEYEARQWTAGLQVPSIYQGKPSTEVDKAWEDLYNDFGISQVPQSQASLLPGAPASLNGNPEYYIVQLTVFHQMHCLNTIRKALAPEYYIDPVTGKLGNLGPGQLRAHLSHCVDSLRQGIMCAGDISPIVWHRNTPNESAIIELEVPHTCRKYDKLVGWAKEHKIQYKLN
ncbi:hypothetical protein NM688_g3949 [Phlebia brevispora]|uniref:Uncharacterized protein n=1 Tax=Phlebia brevispora TaxID=194682 RepID=A0ACC1T4H9_9APHY|nr:hypothetical protein NM688_g3949 [Phlebia brevispora]